eukprot:Amastigsp_a176631_77.p2 type:complete len:170 gc:universal Amastigsp_a176631_77:551-42(-)
MADNLGVELRCQVCAQPESRTALSRCAACHAVYYCGTEHQKEDWKAHKANCKKFKAAAESGVFKEITSEGQGDAVGARSSVSIHFTGMLTTGLHYYSTRGSPSPFTFAPARDRDVLRGLVEAVPTMRVKERATLYISPEYSHGMFAPRDLPHNSFLVFDVECVAAERLP